MAYIESSCPTNPLALPFAALSITHTVYNDENCFKIVNNSFSNSTPNTLFTEIVLNISDTETFAINDTTALPANVTLANGDILTIDGDISEITVCGYSSGHAFLSGSIRVTDVNNNYATALDSAVYSFDEYAPTMSFSTPSCDGAGSFSTTLSIEVLNVTEGVTVGALGNGQVEISLSAGAIAGSATFNVGDAITSPVSTTGAWAAFAPYLTASSNISNGVVITLDKLSFAVANSLDLLNAIPYNISGDVTAYATTVTSNTESFKVVLGANAYACVSSNTTTPPNMLAVNIYDVAVPNLATAANWNYLAHQGTVYLDMDGFTAGLQSGDPATNPVAVTYANDEKFYRAITVNTTAPNPTVVFNSRYSANSATGTNDRFTYTLDNGNVSGSGKFVSVDCDTDILHVPYFLTKDAHFAGQTEIVVERKLLSGYAGVSISGSEYEASTLNPLVVDYPSTTVVDTDPIKDLYDYASSVPVAPLDNYILKTIVESTGSLGDMRVTDAMQISVFKAY